MRWRRRSSDSRRPPRAPNRQSPWNGRSPRRWRPSQFRCRRKGLRRVCRLHPIRPSLSYVLAPSLCVSPSVFAASTLSTSQPDPRSSSIWKGHRDLPWNARLNGASAYASTMPIFPTIWFAVWTPRNSWARFGSSARTRIRRPGARFESTWIWLRMSPTTFGRMGTGSTGISRRRRRPTDRSCPPWADLCRPRCCLCRLVG